MYLNFYRMTKAPFHITPDPEFLFLSPSHKEALGTIIYCVSKKKGFVSRIGEVGTGKTTLVRSYLAKSTRKEIKPIYVFNPAISFAELLKTVFQELGVEPRDGSVYDMVQQLHSVLVQEYRNDQNIVLIIDEAQNMPVPTFEQLRILSNLETPKEKLLQIILVGQPELAEKLASRELRQLNQRLALRAKLLPLSPVESRDYIIFRLGQVTASPHDIFSPRALSKIIKAAQGTPRMLNILCDNALIAGFGYKAKKITGAIVKQVITDFAGKDRHPLFSWKYAFVGSAFFLAVAALNGMNISPPFSQSAFVGNNHPETTGSPAPVTEKPSPDPALAAAEIAGATNESKGPPLSIKIRDNNPPDRPAPAATMAALVPSPPIIPEIDNSPNTVMRTPAAIEMAWHNTPDRGGLKKRTVKKGDYLSRICLDIYGFVNNQLIRIVKENNPAIIDADLIFTGDTIVFPELSTPDGTQTDSQWR